MAVVPPLTVIEHLHDLLTDVRRHVPERSIRWTSPERWHVTLAFMGDPDEDVDEDVAEHLAPLEQQPSIAQARLAGAGAFGRQVLWIGLEDSPALDTLAGVARSIPALVRGTGVVPDRRAWRPHLTIARLRAGSPDVLVHALAAYRGPAWDIDELHLVRSSGGAQPVHRIVASLPLQPV